MKVLILLLSELSGLITSCATKGERNTYIVTITL